MQDRKMHFIPLLHGKAEKTKRSVGSCGLSWQLRGALLTEIPWEDQRGCWQKSGRGSLYRLKSRGIINNMLKYTDKVTQDILTIKPRTVKALNLSLINKKLEEAIQWAQLPKLLCPFAPFNLIVLVLPAAFVLLPCSGNLLLVLAGLTLVPHGWFVDSQEGWEGKQEGEEDGKRSHRSNLLDVLHLS